MGLFKSAEDWYKKGMFDYELAIDLRNRYGSTSSGYGLKYFEKAAQKGHLPTKYRIAHIYMFDYPLDKVPMSAKERINKALPYFLEVAETGDMDAQYGCGCAYEDKGSLFYNLETALSWYEKAAAQGHAEAAKRCDVIRMETATDIREKAKYTERVATQTKDGALYHECGRLYLEIGDLQKAYHYLQEAARLWDPPYKHRAQVCYELALLVSKHLENQLSGELNKGLDSAEHWARKAVQYGMKKAEPLQKRLTAKLEKEKKKEEEQRKQVEEEIRQEARRIIPEAIATFEAKNYEKAYELLKQAYQFRGYDNTLGYDYLYMWAELNYLGLGTKKDTEMAFWSYDKYIGIISPEGNERLKEEVNLSDVKVTEENLPLISLQVGRCLFRLNRYRAAYPLLMTAGENGYVDAYLMLAVLFRSNIPEIGHNEKKANLMLRSWLRNIKPGEKVLYGTYEQNLACDDALYKKHDPGANDPVSWTVLDVKENGALLLMDQALHYKEYDVSLCLPPTERSIVRARRLSTAEFQKYIIEQQLAYRGARPTIYARTEQAKRYRIGYEVSGNQIRFRRELSEDEEYYRIGNINLKKQDAAEIDSLATPCVDWKLSDGIARCRDGVEDFTCVERPAIWIGVEAEPSRHDSFSIV